MKLELHSSRIEISESTRSYVERRIAFALGRFADVIESVAVRLEDINGPRGGIDKLCRMRVRLVGQRSPIIAEVVDLETRVAVDLTAERIGRAVARNLDRLSDRRPGDKRLPLAEAVEEAIAE